jgi:hypothetical protein
MKLESERPHLIILRREDGGDGVLADRDAKVLLLLFQLLLLLSAAQHPPSLTISFYEEYSCTVSKGTDIAQPLLH